MDDDKVDDSIDDNEPQPMLTIRQANGGFIITDEEGIETPFEEREFIPTDTDVEMTQRMLNFITDFFGLSGNKHDAERIYVTIEKKKGK